MKKNLKKYLTCNNIYKRKDLHAMVGRRDSSREQWEMNVRCIWHFQHSTSGSMLVYFSLLHFSHFKFTLYIGLYLCKHLEKPYKFI